MPTRGLKESICTSDTINALSPEAEVFFYRLMVVSDDFGLMDGRKSILRGRCYPLKEVSDHQLEFWLSEMVEAPLIHRYEVSGKPFIKIIEWAKYQRIRNMKPRYPLPVDSNPLTTVSKSRTIDRSSPQSAAPARTTVSVTEPVSAAIASKSRTNGFELPGWVPVVAWEGYVEMRVKMRKPMTERSKELAIRKLEALRAKGYDPQAVLDEATEKSWQGLYEPKGGVTSTSGGSVMPGMEGVV